MHKEATLVHVMSHNCAMMPRTCKRQNTDGGADEWYRGEIAKEIAAHMEDIGGLITTDDLAAYSPRYADTQFFSSGIAAKLCIGFVKAAYYDASCFAES